MSSEQILEFYSGKSTDDQGRYITDLHAWPDESLEEVHDFVQWMFPLIERSAFNPAAPTLDTNVIGKFKCDKRMQNNLRLSFVRMLTFYGFKVRYQANEPVITHHPNFRKRTREWMTPGNHNYLRITRILKSLSLLGLEPEARKFFESLSEIYFHQNTGNPVISEMTFNFWKTAVEGV